MKSTNFFLTLLFLTLTTSCTRFGVIAANFPSLFSDQKITRDISFGSEYGSKLDVYKPAKTQGLAPVIVFFYGGKWTNGSKNDYRFAADAFTSKGYIVVIPDYVKYPKVKYPAWQRDAAKAFVWTHKNIANYGGDADKVFVMGHSAGAHIGAILATDNEFLKQEGGNSSWIKAFAGLAGPYNFTPDEPDLIDMFGNSDVSVAKMNVSTYIDGKQPPMLLLRGEDDKDVGAINATKLVDAINHHGGKVTSKTYPNIDHIDIIAALSKIRKSKAPVIEDIDKFFR